MSQPQARCNCIARSSGEHGHGYPQLMLGWRGTMDYEFSRGSERLVLDLGGIGAQQVVLERRSVRGQESGLTQTNESPGMPVRLTSS